MDRCYTDHTKRLVDGTRRNDKMIRDSGVRVDYRQLQGIADWVAVEEQGWREGGKNMWTENNSRQSDCALFPGALDQADIQAP